jgi:DNA-binding NtrC family response regulator
MQQSFPGNIRELRNLIVRASILSEGSLVDEAHILSALSLETGETLSTYRDDNEPILNSLKENESAYLEHLLEQSDGDKKAVAKQLGISLRTLYRKLKA